MNTGTISQINEDRQNVIDQGGFLQEEFLTLHERLLLTAGIRADRSSNDANTKQLFYYPKASASYRVPGSWAFINGLKLRAAFGESGNEPLYGQKFGELQALNYQGFPRLAGLTPTTERWRRRCCSRSGKREYEGGFDLTLFDSTMTLGVTGFQKNISSCCYSARCRCRPDSRPSTSTPERCARAASRSRPPWPRSSGGRSAGILD